MPTYLPTYIHTYIHTYIPTHLPTYQPTYLPTYLPTHLPTYLPTYIRVGAPAQICYGIWESSIYYPGVSSPLKLTCIKRNAQVRRDSVTCRFLLMPWLRHCDVMLHVAVTTIGPRAKKQYLRIFRLNASKLCLFAWLYICFKHYRLDSSPSGCLIS